MGTLVERLRGRRMKKLGTRGLVPLLVIGAIAAITRLFPQVTRQVIDAAKAISQNNTFPDSEYWQLVEGSVYDGDTLQVTDGSRELKIRLCGIDAPELEQPLGIEARDHLRSLIDQGDGTLIVLPVEKDRYGRTVAEIFVPVVGAEEEIPLTGQMVRDGMAYHYAQYSGNCPNGVLLAGTEEIAKAEKLGVWAGEYQLPWEYRRQK